MQEYLADKTLLLILDNCEHLIDACAAVVQRLLHHCWQLHILVTSREELRIPGETVYAVLPLGLPDAAGQTRDRILDSHSAQLFVDRMGGAPPLRATHDEDFTAIGQICRQLDGIPLALELAAPLVRSMTLAEIAQHLHDQMAILVNDARNPIPRHKTMHSALVWSYRLLTPTEQRILACVAVFAGGWTLAAAQAVCGDEWDVDVHERLKQLVFKSWVLVEFPDGQRRYRLLEPVRQFAQAQLTACGELDALRHRHAQYFLTLAEQMGQRARHAPGARLAAAAGARA